MSDLPVEILYGKVVGQFLVASVDGGDANENPDSSPATGKITFTPALKLIKTAAPVATVFTNALQYNLAAGFLVNTNGEDGVWLIAGTYSVSYAIAGATVTTHPIVVTAAHTDAAPLDLTTYVPPGGPSLTDSQYDQLLTLINATDARVVTMTDGAEPNAVDDVNGLTGSVALVAADVFALGATGGAGDLINTLTSAQAASALNLALGNVQHVTSTAGNYTLPSPTGLIGGGTASLFTLVIDTTTNGHTPTFFGSISWAGGATPLVSWTAGVRQMFQFLTLNGTNWLGWHLTPSTQRQQVTYSVSGVLTAAAGGFRLYNDSGEARTISSVRASVGTAPTGAAVLVDVHKNGSTIFTTQGDRATIAVSTFTDTAIPNVTSWADGDYLTVDVDQIGSTIAGSNLTVTVVFTQGA